MALFLFRRGDGNNGNHPRFFVDIADDQNPWAALHALCVSESIPTSRARRHIMRCMETDGDKEYGVSGWIHQGPDGEDVFGAAWLTAELEPYTEDEFEKANLARYALRDALDYMARYFYREVSGGGLREVALEWRTIDRAGESTDEVDLRFEAALIAAGFPVKHDPIEEIASYEGDEGNYVVVSLESGIDIQIHLFTHE